MLISDGRAAGSRTATGAVAPSPLFFTSGNSPETLPTPAGSAIADATIVLYDEAQSEVERLQSDITGNFASSRSLAGSYELVVTGPGLTPLRGTVAAGPPSTFARSSITVQLGVAGGCSSAFTR